MLAKLVIGAGQPLDLAYAAWKRIHPDHDIRSLVIPQGLDYEFDVRVLDDHSPADTTAYAAFDNRFLNFKRTELIELLRARGYVMEALVCLDATVAATATVGDNAFIGDGAIVNVDARIGAGTFVGARAIIGQGAIVEDGAWIEAGVVIGDDARIGAQTTLGLGVTIARNVQIGELCIIDTPGLYRAPIAACTYFHPAFDEPIRIPSRIR